MFTIIYGEKETQYATSIMAKLVEDRIKDTNKPVYADVPFAFPHKGFLSDIILLAQNKELKDCIIAVDYMYGMPGMWKQKTNKIW